jgi:hypothetical protein
MTRALRLLAWAGVLWLALGSGTTAADVAEVAEVAEVAVEAEHHQLALDCTEDAGLPPVSDPWLEIEADPGADPAVPGYIELLRFRSQPSGVKGRALVVRLANPGSHPQLFRAESREWAIELTTREGELAFDYSYLVPGKQNHVWIYRPQLRRVERISYDAPGGADATQRLCHTLAASGLANEVKILQRTTGRAIPDAALRRAIDPGRLTRGSR